MTERDIPEVNLEDLAKTQLELKGLPVSDKFAVFVRDPQNPDQYWFRRIGIKRGSIKLPSGKEMQYFDVYHYDAGLYNQIPCPANQLQGALQHVMSGEQEIARKKPGESAVVGVARYEGENALDLEKVISLVGAKYAEMSKAQSN